MKLRNTILTLLLFGGGFAQAAIWTNSGNGNFTDGANWDTGKAPIDAATDKDIIIKGNVTVSDIGPRPIDGQNITVSDGATLEIQGGTNSSDSISNLASSNITITNGGKIVANATRINSRRPSTITCLVQDGFHMGAVRTFSDKGSIKLELGLVGSLSGTTFRTATDLPTIVSLSLDTRAYSGVDPQYIVQTRTLINMSNRLGGTGVFTFEEVGSEIKDLSGNLLSRVAAESDLTLDSTGLGKYYAYTAADGDLIVKYVQAVPEPSMAILGIVGLVALTLRRSRK